MGDDGYADAAAVPVPDAGDDLTRRAIIAAHDAKCTCGDYEVHYLPLNTREAAIVEAWRADRGGDMVRVETAEKYRQRAEQAEAAIEQAQAALLQGGQTASIRARAALAALDEGDTDG